MMQTYLDFCKDVTREAGHILLQHFDKPRTTKAKTSTIDLVTEVDELAQDYIVHRIREQFPDHGIIAEENNESTYTDQAYVWYIDPIDGTTNYWHRQPFFAVSVALCYDNQPVVGVVYAPRLNEMYWATRQMGAWNDAGPLHVSQVATMQQALVATGFPYQRAPGTDNNLVEFGRVMPYVQGMRRCGAASLDLASVATGRLDGYWEFHLSPWDSMAGILLVLEAGGQISTVRPTGAMNGPGGILASNGLLHATLQKLLLG